jgi:putative peptidoglycan lipid II flippase
VSTRADEPPHGGPSTTLVDGAPLAPDRVARNSVSVAAWTIVARATGFLLVAVVAAVLGPTFFGNTYQAVNQIPNLAYELLAGNLIVSLLVPPLVRQLDAGSPAAAERLAGGFLGVITAAFATVSMLLLLTGPIVLRLLTLGVDDPAVREAQLRAGLVLLAFVVPQLVLYGVAGTGMAVQQARGRYGLATAAYSVENLVIVVLLVVYRFAFGAGTDVETVGMLPLIVLGGGSTLAVAVHAGVQWWGARRCGTPLRMRAGWRDPQVTEVAKLAASSIGFAALNALRLFGMLIAAGSVAGGVVAFQLAFGLFNLPVAIGGRPIAWALVPRLTRLSDVGLKRRFLVEWGRGVAISVFVVAPVAVLYAVLAAPIADLVARGAMQGHGADLVAAALAGLAFGVVGESAFIHGTHACYSRRDARIPRDAMAIRVALTACGLVFAVVATDSTATLAVVGISVACGDLISALYLGHRLRRALGAHDRLILPSLLRTVAASGAMALVMVLTARGWTDLGRAVTPAIPGLILTALVGLAGYLVVQAALRSPELEPVRCRVFRTRGRA